MMTHAAILAVAILAAPGGDVAASAAADVVRADCYVRESLGAINDWETILAAQGKTLGDDSLPLAFPVPESGEAVEWPNPIPRLLMPADDDREVLGLRLVDEKVEVTRSRPNGTPAVSTTPPGEAVVGYWHPGGGAKDHWYHAYQRRFDALETFRPVVAPFALHVASPVDLRRGVNHLDLRVRNVTRAPQQLMLTLNHYRPELEASQVEQVVRLDVGQEQALRLPVTLDAEGGTLLVLRITAGAATYQVPLLTHVERLSAVLDSLAQILADTPDAAAARSVAQIKRRAAAWSVADADAGLAWRGLFDEASALREELLLRRIPCESLLFVKRKPYDSEQPYMDAHHLRNPPGGSICRLTPVRPQGTVTPVVDSLGEGIYRDLYLHWDGGRFLFAFGNGSDHWDGAQSYHIYEAAVDGSGLRQLTFGVKNDCEPFYLPGDEIGFTSDRSEHFVMCGAARHVANLFHMRADGSAIAQLSFNTFNDFNPAVMPDGRILYSRWEYNERSVTSLHNPFTVFPDGTMMAPYYGNATIRPNVVMFPRPVPGSQKIMGLFTAHHGQTHGPIGLIDRARAVNGPEAITLLTPGIPITGEKAEDSRRGWYSDPLPLSEDTYLCSFTPTVVPWLARSWAIYFGDRHGNLALVYRDPAISCAEPVPLVRRAAPAAVARPADEAQRAAGEATLVVADVYRDVFGTPRGGAAFLRIIEDVPRKGVHAGGVVLTAGTSVYTVKRILGTVPVEADGSAHFVVPADRNIYFELLGRDQLEIQRMRSVVCLKPGERRACIGCHEPLAQAPPSAPIAALRRPASRPTPPPWGDAILSFLRDVQPVLNAKCVACHTFDRPTSSVILTDDLTERFNVAYEELLPYVTTANAMRWDRPEDVYPQPPYTYGSKVSPLMQLLRDGHHGVEFAEDERLRLVNWIDANAIYYDRYESAYGDERRIFAEPAGATLRAVFARRCASCHGRSDGQGDTWWLSLNRHNAVLSRALMAPLARAAGGWGRCDGAVFANRDDADYQAIRAALVALHNELSERPREDLLSLRGSAAEQQAVRYPEPPPRRRDTLERLAPGQWIGLGELSWTKADAGWSAAGDGLPRRDRDIAGEPLRLAARVYRRGIGTHAPSEIAYDLSGKYDRFQALVGAAEAGGSVVFQVYADEKLVYDSGPMAGLRGTKTVDAPIAGTRRLRLVVTDAGDGINSDMANWVEPRLRRAETAEAQ